MAIVRWKPSGDLFAVRDELNRMFDSFFENNSSEDGSMLMPPTDMLEDNDKYIVTVELPGMNKDQVKITVKDDVLTISGSKNRQSESKSDRLHRVERSFGSFCRTLTLPSKVVSSKISADLKDGILKVTLPKAEESKAREISIAG